jgi:hypothetical protein
MNSTLQVAQARIIPWAGTGAARPLGPLGAPGKPDHLIHGRLSIGRLATVVTNACASAFAFRWAP